MKYFLGILCFCSMTLQGICQNYELFQKIDPISEKEKMLEFVKEFGTCTDSVKIQKYIEFPYFIGRHTCNGLMSDFESFPVFVNDSIETAYYKSASILRFSPCGCNNPFYDFSNKVRISRNIRDSVLSNLGNMLEFYFSYEKNRKEYCGWIINAYHFPISFDNIETSNIGFESGAYPHENEKGTSIGISGYGFGSIIIVKINGEYKVVYVGYYWN